MSSPVRLLPLILACVASPAFAGPDTDSQGWTTLSASGPISGPVSGSVDMIGRFGDAANGLYEIEMVATLSVDVGRGVQLGGGYVRDPTYNDGDFVRMEQRAREQISAKLGTFAGGKLSGRLRAEQRWIGGADGTGWRLRPWLKWTLPLNAHGTAFNLSHESFVNLNTTNWGARSGYDRMRNTISVSTPLVKHLTIEGGYLNQYVFRHAQRDQMAHVATLGLSWGW